MKCDEQSTYIGDRKSARFRGAATVFKMNKTGALILRDRRVAATTIVMCSSIRRNCSSVQGGCEIDRDKTITKQILLGQ